MIASFPDLYTYSAQMPIDASVHTQGFASLQADIIQYLNTEEETTYIKKTLVRTILLQ